MTWQILVGDVREQLARVEPGSVQTCVTSPPYWGLRDYGTGSWEGGDPACDHVARLQHREQPGRPTQDGRFRHTSTPQPVPYSGTCGRCGAMRIDQQIGLEATPEAYVAVLVDVFRGVRDALADDGTLWLNLGDSYSSGTRNSQAEPSSKGIVGHPGMRHAPRRPPAVPGLKPKDLVGIPWMVAFALRADGWYLRSDVIWAKPNPMPESVGDRPTSAHEHVFLLSKQPRYFYDADAIREPDKGRDHPRSVLDGQPSLAPSGGRHSPHTGLRTPTGRDGLGANARNVWSITTKPFRGAHFAVMPPDLAERCILAGSAPGDLVLDPFAGAATTGMVALRHDRSFVGIELSPEYADLGRRRTREDAPLFNEPAELPDAA